MTHNKNNIMRDATHTQPSVTLSITEFLTNESGKYSKKKFDKKTKLHL